MLKSSFQGIEESTRATHETLPESRHIPNPLTKRAAGRPLRNRDDLAGSVGLSLPHHRSTYLIQGLLIAEQ